MDDGGLGDNICRLPALRYIKDQFPFVYPQVCVPDYFYEFAKHFLKDMIVRPFSQNEKYYKAKLPGRKTCSLHTTMRTHLVDHAFHMLADKQVEDKYKNYLQLRPNEIDVSRFNLPEKFCVLTTGFTAQNREFPAKTINELSDYIKSKGYEVVFLGSLQAKTGIKQVDDIEGNFSAEIDYSKGLNLIDQTSLLEASAIISKAQAIIGVDNGLLHLAGCTETVIVCGFTNVESKYRLPYRHDQLGWNCYVVEPDQDLKCRFCQSNWDFIFDQDFRFCYYQDYKCVQQMTAQKFINHLEKIL